MYAYKTCQFTHGDLHLDNILMKETSVREITLDGQTVPLYGYRVLLMDLEGSRVNVGPDTIPGYTPVLSLFKDMKMFVNKMLNLADFMKIQYIEQANRMLRDWVEQKETDYTKIYQLLPLLEKTTLTGFNGGALVHRRNVKPYLSKHRTHR
jgi:hypothetical protein